MWLADAVPADLQRWVVDEKRGTHLLRVPKAGTLAELDRAFNSEAVARYESLLLAIEDAPTKKDVTTAKKELTIAFPAGEPPRTARRFPRMPAMRRPMRFPRHPW